MPRQARLDAPGILQHVMARGIERRKIFANDKDRTSFLERLTVILEETQTQCYAFRSCCIFVPNRDQVMESLAKQGIASQIGTYSLHMHKAFNQNKNCDIKGTMPGSKYAFDHCLTLPMYFEMTDQEQNFVVETLKNILKEY